MAQYILMLRHQVENLLEKIRPQWRALVSHLLWPNTLITCFQEQEKYKKERRISEIYLHDEEKLRRDFFFRRQKLDGWKYDIIEIEISYSHLDRLCSTIYSSISCFYMRKSLVILLLLCFDVTTDKHEFRSRIQRDHRITNGDGKNYYTKIWIMAKHCFIFRNDFY